MQQENQVTTGKAKISIVQEMPISFDYFSIAFFPVRFPSWEKKYAQ
jgi:hypothetical protein